MSARWRKALLVLALAIPAWSDVVKLYLKDGTYQLVREYKKEGDRVRYYSTERSDWEEIPLALVDFEKTEGEIVRREESSKAEAKALAEEDKAEREAVREVERVPVEPGAYLIKSDTALEPIPVAEVKVVNNSRRRLLQLASPIPIVTGKSTVETDGLHAAAAVTNARPEFYFRISQEERFGMVRMGEHKGNRVVENLTIIPVTKEVVEEPQLVETFRQQVGENLYKIWPVKPLEPGEYALIEYTEGKVNLQVWAFGYHPGSK